VASAELKLVRGPERASSTRSSHGRGSAVVLGSLAIGALVAGTLLGADRARSPSRLQASAQETLFRILERGPHDSEVLAALRNIRSEMGRRPLDAFARVVYAALVLEMSSGNSYCEVATFHARRASELAPVTVPVVAPASIVLTRCGEEDRGLSLVREMFGYAPESAAELLTNLGPFVDAERAREAVPAEPEAWLAWLRELREQGRAEESDRWALESHRRWPDHLETLQDLAARAASRSDWIALGRLLPLDLEIPERRETAILYAYRARARAEAGDVAGAHSDADKAAHLCVRHSAVLMHAGDALLVAGDADAARRLWRRALFELPADSDDSPRSRARLLVRLARLEDADGEPATALRAWRDVLTYEPGNAEAIRRVGELDVLGP
jgi:tetratricopeptide (TPR) repeat protein